MSFDKKKKFYAVEENVYVKPLKEFGVIESLNIQPKTEESEGVYEASVKVGDGVRVFKLWEIDKVRESKEKSHVHPDRTRKTRQKDTIFFAKTHQEAKIPTKRDEDAGWDVYACFDEESIVLQPGEIKLIPTGIASSFSSKYFFNIKHERGSTGVIGLTTLSGVIDSGFRNEWKVVMQNTSNKPIAITKEVTEKVISDDFILYPYSRAICQGTLELSLKVNTKTISYEELLKFTSERGTGMLGSSGK